MNNFRVYIQRVSSTQRTSSHICLWGDLQVGFVATLCKHEGAYSVVARREIGIKVIHTTDYLASPCGLVVVILTFVSSTRKSLDRLRATRIERCEVRTARMCVARTSALQVNDLGFSHFCCPFSFRFLAAVHHVDTEPRTPINLTHSALLAPQHTKRFEPAAQKHSHTHHITSRVPET